MDATEPRWLDAREQRAWRGFLAMQAVVDRALATQLQRDADLSSADYGVLVTLSESETGELRSYAIAEALQWEASRLSHQLRRMERRGLVERRGCPEDRRGVNIAITPTGRATIDTVAPLHVAEVRRVFVDRLDDAQLEAMATIADQVCATPALTPDPDPAPTATSP